jgi:hypothetical protein
MTESKRAFYFKETRTPSFKMGVTVMRCYFMRNGHVEDVQELFGLSEEEATAKAHALFSEREHLFEGFELWDHARFLTGHPGPGADGPLRDDPGI